MSSARRSTLVLIAGAFLIVRPAVAAQWNASPYFTTFAPPTDISFTISTDRTSYVSGDPITLTAAPTSRPTEASSSPQSSIPLLVIHPFSDEISDLRVNDQANGILISRPRSWRASS